LNLSVVPELSTPAQTQQSHFLLKYLGLGLNEILLVNHLGIIDN